MVRVFGIMSIFLIYISTGGQCSVIPINKRKPQVADPCAGRRCGELCEAPSGRMMLNKAALYCQPDGSCGPDARPVCTESLGQDPWLQIADLIKNTLINKSTNQVTEMMKEHFIIMKLLNENNIWASDKLANIGHQLLPGNIDGRELGVFVDRMAQNVAKNPCIVDFLTQITETTYSQLKALVQSEGEVIFPDVVAFAMVLDRLTSAQKEDWRVMQTCQDIWDREISLEDMLSVSSPFEVAKILTVDKCIDRIISEAIKHTKDRTGFLQVKFLLTANILEAVFEDLRTGFFSNAKAGWTLVQNQPVAPLAPIRQTENGENVEMNIPVDKDWIDLYVSWNMAFVSGISPQLPYFISKLLIPSVSDYNDVPELFFHIRIFSLHNFISWALLTRIHDNFKNSDMNWATREVTQEWGRQNLRCSGAISRSNHFANIFANIFNW